jgi:hypothetical protein
MATDIEFLQRDYRRPKIGVFGCGCWFYWDQFEGLKERLIGHQAVFEERLRQAGVDVVSGGLVDTPRGAARAGDAFRRQGIDFLICYVSTYALSSTVLPVVQRAGVPVAGELDLKNCLAMLITDNLEAGGSFAEIHPCDFEQDIVLVGHDGPHHVAVAEGRPVLRGLSLYHGKRGSGVSVEFQLKNGPVTCAGLTQTYDGRFKFVVAEGESLPGPIPPTGNTNTRCRFPPDVSAFIENWSLEGPTHHFALGVGHIAHTIEGFCRCWGIECANVTDPAYRRAQHTW